MKKQTLQRVATLLGLGLVVGAGLAFGIDNGGESKAAQSISKVLIGSQTIIQAGAVAAALWGGYQILFGENGKGAVNWFLLIIGGAFAGAYPTMADVIIGFFK